WEAVIHFTDVTPGANTFLLRGYARLQATYGLVEHTIQTVWTCRFHRYPIRPHLTAGSEAILHCEDEVMVGYRNSMDSSGTPFELSGRVDPNSTQFVRIPPLAGKLLYIQQISLRVLTAVYLRVKVGHLQMGTGF